MSLGRAEHQRLLALVELRHELFNTAFFTFWYLNDVIEVDLGEATPRSGLLAGREWPEIARFDR